jgi:hypothetical protein
MLFHFGVKKPFHSYWDVRDLDLIARRSWTSQGQHDAGDGCGDVDAKLAQ